MNEKLALLIKLEKGEKFKMGEKLPQFPFLPHLNHFFEFFDGPTSPRKLIKIFEGYSGKSSLISDSSLDNLNNKGVSKKTAEQVLTFFDELMPEHMRDSWVDVLLDQTPKRPISVYETYFGWRNLIYSFKESASGDIGRFELVFEFLVKRCQQAENTYSRAASIRKTTGSRVKFVESHYKTVRRNTLLSDHDFQILKKEMMKLAKNDKKGINDIAVKPALSFYLDFYFQFIATCEVAFLLEWEDCSKGFKEEVAGSWSNGYFSEIITETIDSNTTFFNKFLNVFKSAYNKDSELAKFIPIEKLQGDGVVKEDIATVKHNAQLGQLKDWRKGKNTPSFQKLNGFITGICISMNGDLHYIYDGYVLMGYMCLAMDKHKKLLVKGFGQETVDKCFKAYPEYWKQIRKQHM